MHPFIKFRNKLLREGLEAFGLYYGFYEGIVADTDDPEKRARIKIKCPAVYGETVFAKWALPFGMFSGTNVGFYAIPPVDSTVWITFKNGNPEFPLWTYGWYPKNKAPEDVEPTKFLFTTPAGYKLLFDESNELISLYLEDGREINMDKEKTEFKSGNNIINLAEKVSINFGGVNMVDYLEGLTNIIKQGIMTGGAGPYVWSPDVIAQFEENIVELKKMME